MAERELCDKELQLALKANKDQADIYITRAKVQNFLITFFPICWGVVYLHSFGQNHLLST